MIGGAAALVTLTAAGILLFGGDEAEQTEPEAALLDPSGAPVPAAELAPDPLDTTKSLADASQRGLAWDPEALLAGITALVQNGKPAGPLELRYGRPLAEVGPGATLGADRLVLSYDGGKFEEKNVRTKRSEPGLPDPNCPMEVAWRKATEAGLKRSDRLVLSYAHSKKHGRPVWTVTRDGSKDTRIVDGSTCAVLLR